MHLQTGSCIPIKIKENSNCMGLNGNIGYISACSNHTQVCALYIWMFRVIVLHLKMSPYQCFVVDQKYLSPFYNLRAYITVAHCMLLCLTIVEIIKSYNYSSL